MGKMTHRWYWRKWLPERRGQLCRVVVTGKMNSALVEFEDGARVVTSRYAVRKIKRCDDLLRKPDTSTKNRERGYRKKARSDRLNFSAMAAEATVEQQLFGLWYQA